MTAKGPIGIAGAGIAGLTAAVALTLAGFRCTVYERQAALEPIGAGLQLGPTATAILAKLGIALPETACFPDAIDLRNAASGAALNAIPVRGAFETKYGAPYATLLRAELQAALLARAHELECDIRFGAPVEPQSARTPRFSTNNTDEDSPSAVIGADGVHSTVRSAISTAPAVRVPITVYRALVPPSALPAPFRTGVTVWMAPGAHLVHYPVQGGDAVNAVLAVDGFADDQTQVAGPPLDTQGWSHVPAAILEAASAWMVWPLLEVRPWKGGTRVVQTIGDAWHAMPPFLASGAVMGIEDGFSLAQSFRACGGDAIRALDRFRDVRGPRVWQASRRSGFMGRTYHMDPPGSLVRDAIIRSLPTPALAARMDWLYRS